jgi:hypothetical protein
MGTPVQSRENWNEGQKGETLGHQQQDDERARRGGLSVFAIASMSITILDDVSQG